MTEQTLLKSGKASLRGQEAVSKEEKALLYGYDNMARSIQAFMYEGRPGRSKRKEHTDEEYQEFLEKMVQRCWDNYNSGVKSLGGY